MVQTYTDAHNNTHNVYTHIWMPHIYRCTHTPTPTLPHAHAHTFSLTRTYVHAHTHSLSHVHMYMHTHILSHTYICTCTHTNTPRLQTQAPTHPPKRSLLSLCWLMLTTTSLRPAHNTALQYMTTGPTAHINWCRVIQLAPCTQHSTTVHDHNAHQTHPCLLYTSPSPRDS